MSDFVWVKLDRDEACLVASLCEPHEFEGGAKRNVLAKLRAALSEPSENQVEKARDCLEAAFRDVLDSQGVDLPVSLAVLLADAAMKAGASLSADLVAVDRADLEAALDLGAVGPARVRARALAIARLRAALLEGSEEG